MQALLRLPSVRFVCGGQPKSWGLDDIKENKLSTETDDFSHGRKVAVAGGRLLDLW
ncbi:MAG TPA: hypothetical protein VNP04_22965 [Alphaproteobacteria bacterium]|nr:hypothetical protein [Alphaproteobacteria bacterium]